jgi:hypothetical protein
LSRFVHDLARRSRAGLACDQGRRTGQEPEGDQRVEDRLFNKSGVLAHQVRIEVPRREILSR